MNYGGGLRLIAYLFPNTICTSSTQTSFVDQPDQMEQVDLNGRNNVNAEQLQLFQIKL